MTTAVAVCPTQNMTSDRISFLFVFLLFIPLAIYIPNSVGIGLALPYNLLLYGGAALLIGVCWCATPLCRVVLTQTRGAQLIDF